MNSDDQKPEQENQEQESSQATDGTENKPSDQEAQPNSGDGQKQPPKIDDFEDFEDWDDANDLDLDNFDEAVLEDDFTPGSIDEDFSDFEQQVQNDQAAAIGRKKGSGGALKTVFSLVVIGGLIGGGIYGYFTFKDDFAKLLDAQSFIETDTSLSADNYFDDLKAPSDSQAPQGQEEGYDFANRGGRVEDALPQPTPITEEEGVAEPMPLNEEMPESVTLSEVISNGSDDEPLYDVLAEETAEVADQAVDAFGDALNDAERMAENTVEDMSAFVEDPLAQEEMVDQAPVQPQPVEQVMQDTVSDPLADENYDPFGDPAPVMEEEETIPDVAASNEETIPEELVGEADVVAQAPESDMDLFADETEEVVEENNIPVADIEPVEETVTPSPEIVEEAEVVEEVQVEQKVAEEPAPVSKPAPKVTIEKKKPAIDPDVYASASKEATVYELIQTQDLALARSAMSQGRYEDALQIYNRLYAKNPDNFEIIRGRNAALKYLGQAPSSATNSAVTSQSYTQQPTQSFDQPVSGHASVEYARQAVSAASKGDNAAAMQMIEKAMNADPRNAMHAYNAAIIYDRAGDRSSAIRYYEKALELDALYGSNKELPRGQIYDRLAVIR